RAPKGATTRAGAGEATLDGAPPELLVLEMATDRFGEIAELAAIAPPSVALVTRVAAAHLHALGDLDGVEREKGDLIAALPPDGLAVLNADDPRVARMRGRTSADAVLVSTAGDEAADIRAGNIQLDRGGTAFDIVVRGGGEAVLRGGRAVPIAMPAGRDDIVLATYDVTVPARIPWLGAHFVTAALMAVAVGRRFGMTVDDVVARLTTLPPQKGRLNPLPGRAGSTILDDSYNASPAAVLAALDAMAALPAGRRIAVLGDMAELGDAAAEAHRAVGVRAAAVVDVLVTRGEAAEGIAAGARGAGMAAERVVVTYRAQDAIAAVEPWLSAETIVLVKGSAITRMEHVAAGLLAAPESAADVLVRQDAAWRQIVLVRPDRPTWLEIDLGAIADNTRLLKARSGGAQLMAVIKADAYGHGAVRVARTVLHNGADRLGVACLAEAAALRREGIDAPILVLGWTPAWQARDAVGVDAALAVYDDQTARALDEAGRDLGRIVTVHVKVDTGLHRLGLPPGEAPAFLRSLATMPHLVVEGVFTHLAAADERAAPAREATDAQLDAFRALLGELDAAGLRPPLAHAANSAAVLGRSDAAFDLVRPGIALYGLEPSPDVGGADLRPALSWKTQVAQVHVLAPGEAVGYGRTWTADRPSRVATIPVGYADGFRRAPERWRHVLVRGAESPLVGRVSMDQAAIDVTDIPGVRVGDEVVLIGRQGERSLRAETVAGWLGTINYEVVSQILARVARV
ncbi:MAG: alanine racemase, partial [Ardenticatenales bacterium]